MTQLTALLKQSHLFKGIPDEILNRDILPLGRMQEYRKEQFLIVPRQQVNRIGFVVSGKIHILHIFETGQHSLMSVISPGRFIGADLVCTHSQLSPYHAMAATNAQVFYLPASLLLAPGKLSEPLRMDCLRRMLELIANENMKKEYRLAILSQNGLRERITAYLSMQARKRSTTTFSIPFSRDEMASFLCVNRSALSHELSRMQQEGLISFRKNEFSLHGWDLNT